MKVWVVNPYGAQKRLYFGRSRAVRLIKELNSRGHSVTWWVSDFIHSSKEKISDDDKLKAGDAISPAVINYVQVSKYKSNVSLLRAIFEYRFGKGFYNSSLFMDPPDVIVMFEPSLFFGNYIIKYANNNSVPVVLDVIDLWPEMFECILPKFLLPFRDQLFSLFFRSRKMAVQNSAAIVAVSQDYLDVYMKYTMNVVSKNITKSSVIYWGYPLNDIDLKKNESSYIENEIDVFVSDKDLVVIYAGSLGEAYDMNIILRSIQYVYDNNLPIKFIIAGDGSAKQSFISSQLKYPDVVKFFGQIAFSDLPSIYMHGDIGLVPYLECSKVSMPIKLYDYIAAGMGIASSLGLEISRLVESRSIGFNYTASNVTSLMDGLEYLTNNPIKLQEFKQNALLLSKEYDSKFQYDKYSKIIESIPLSG